MPRASLLPGASLPPPPERIALISSQAFSIPNFRGALVRAWVCAGAHVFALAPDYDADSRDAVRRLGAEPVDYRLARVGRNPFADLQAVAELARILARLRPDATFSYFVKPVIYGNLAARLVGIGRRFSMVEGAGYVFSDSPAPSLRRRALRMLVSRLYRIGLQGAERIFFLNRDDIALFVEGGLVDAARVVDIGGIGVELPDYACQPPRAEVPVFILVARLLAEKGVREYVAAARRIRALRPDIRFLLVGGTDANPGSVGTDELAAWAAEGIVEWSGHVADVRPWLARASVFVLPSYYREGVPRSIQEAMAMARAVITTDMPGCRDTVEPGRNGLLVPPRDIDALCRAMQFFIDDPARCVSMGEASRQLAHERFDVRRSTRLMLTAMGLQADTADG